MKHRFDDMTLEELREQSEYQEVQGRSSMSREELIDAMKAVENGATADDSTVTEVDPEDVVGGGVGTVGGQKDSGERSYDDNYVGVAPEYRNSATIANAPVVDDDDEEDTILQRVREKEERNASTPSDPKSFEDWVDDNGTRSIAVTRADKS